jgi:cysteine-rich repeat protein
MRNHDFSRFGKRAAFVAGRIASTYFLAAVLSILACPAGVRADIDVAITSDNAYLFGYGDSNAFASSFGGVINTTSGEIFFCPPSAGGVETYTIPSPAADDYIYVVAWSDDSVSQGLIAQFDGGLNLKAYSGQGDWEVCATGIDFDSSSPPITGGASSINSQITLCNAGTGSPVTTSAGWVGLSGGTAGNLVYGEDNTSGGTFSALSCMDTQARWMWFNADPVNIANPFTADPGTSGHKEYLIFRLPMSAVLSECGNDIVEGDEVCDDGNVASGDCCSSSCTFEDADGDTVCDADDACPGFDDSLDADGDAVPDGCDPCNNSGDRDFTVKPKLMVKKINTDTVPGNDMLSVRGDFISATDFVSLDPAANGARVLVVTVDGTVTTDVTIAGGSGWETSGSGKKHRFRDLLGTNAGITDFQIQDRSSQTSRQVGVKVKGKLGNYPVLAGQEPLRAIVVVGDGAAGECGETAFADGQCAFNKKGTTIKCQP